MTQAFVKVVDGTYRGKPVTDTVFPLVKNYTHGKKGAFVTVDGTKVAGFPNSKIRISVPSVKALKESSKDEFLATADIVEEKSDKELMNDIRERFENLEEMTEAALDGVVRGMVVTGPPGLGKSFGVEKVLEDASLFDKLSNSRPKFGIEKGSASAIGLFGLLYRYAEPGSVLVLDDCDSILYDEVALNLLKAALDTGRKRNISWNSDSSFLRREGIPEKFEFKGSVIFITNINFENVKAKRLKDHLSAILSRCHYLEVNLDGNREKILRIKQIVGDGMLDKYKFSDEEKNAIVKFVEDNQFRLRELSLRMVIKIADLYKMAPKNDKWKRLAETTCLKRG